MQELEKEKAKAKAILDTNAQAKENGMEGRVTQEEDRDVENKTEDKEVDGNK